MNVCVIRNMLKGYIAMYEVCMENNVNSQEEWGSVNTQWRDKEEMRKVT